MIGNALLAAICANSERSRTRMLAGKKEFYWSENWRNEVALLAQDNRIWGQNSVFLEIPLEQILAIREIEGRRIAALRDLDGSENEGITGLDLQYNRMNGTRLIAFSSIRIMDWLFPGTSEEIASETKKIMEGRWRG